MLFGVVSECNDSGMRPRQSATVAWRSVAMPLLMCLVMCVMASGCSMAEPDRVRGSGQRSATVLSSEIPVAGMCPDAGLDTRRVLDCLNSEAAGFLARTGADIGPQTSSTTPFPARSARPSAGSCWRAEAGSAV